MKASSLASIRPLQFSEEVSDGVLFFIDESFQEVAGTSVGALGAVAIPADQYNRFCGWVYRVKKAELGATELADAELKGNSCFARAAFRKARTKEGSSLLRAVDDVAQALDAHGAKVFALWTSQPELLTLRKSSTTLLTTPYVELLHRFKRYMRASSRPEQRGALFLDQIGHRQDMWAACSLQNYMVRSGTATNSRSDSCKSRTSRTAL